jgi:hypothetical protein
MEYSWGTKKVSARPSKGIETADVKSATCLEAVIPTEGYDRREFLKNVGKLTATGIAVGSIGLSPLLQGCNDSADGQEFDCEMGPQTGPARADSAFQVRVKAADAERKIGIPDHPCNGDESLYPNKIGNYTKGLPHNSIGEVDIDSYDALIGAIATGKFEDFELLASNGNLGCPDPSRQRRLVNPQAGYAFDLEGTDSHQLSMRAAPAFDSAEEAGEMAELYWMALLRDVNFLDYNSNPITQAAAEDLSGFSDFRGPKESGAVTTGTLFRDKYLGCTSGPYISQFLLKDCPFGSQFVDQRIQTTAVDFLIDFESWLDVQNGCQPLVSQEPGGLVFCRSGRDLSQYVHIDALYQAYFVACLILLSGGVPLNIGNPYGQTPRPRLGQAAASGCKRSARPGGVRHVWRPAHTGAVDGGLVAGT